LIDLVAYSNHPDQIDILGQLSQDPYADVQQAALDSLARINTREAAHQIASLTGTAPREWIIFALAKITDPAGPELLKALLPNLTTITGKVINFNGEPLADVMIQVFEIQDRDGTLRAQSLSQRAISGSNGDFALSLPDVTETSQPLMKVVKLSNQYGQDDEVFENELPLRIGVDNLIEARTDQFFNKLHIRVERLADSQ
jgi:hypothetical protein